ncbi:NAD(P)/FAD-dependent oxidoreductase [Aquimarina addita]|uniref:NAD(P)/FAD-dependent oxidoreductase n=1 Tax=Aquimarina addita TaxID=870485 RepID=A0ABP6UPR2_9FLAO
MIGHSHIVIVGGGLSGLTSAIHLAKADIPVLLIEKNVYPKHKVCGEYISNEVLPYLQFLDLDLDILKPSRITEFIISTAQGKTIKSKLSLGGFGISRFVLDHYLWNQAKILGVHLINDQVDDIDYDDKGFMVKTARSGVITADFVIGAYGKRSILDRKLNRKFSFNASSWLAVKSHYKADFNSDTVALHNFKGGYAGLSMVENNRVNTCYLVNYSSFKKYKNIENFQKEVMCKNPHLQSFFKNSEPVFDQPITISQINFTKKKAVEHHIFMVGDTAGLIHPLCGNGMAMAIQAAQILCTLLVKNYSNHEFSRLELEKEYTHQWKLTFSKRLYTGRMLQKILIDKGFQEIAHTIANISPWIVPKIINQTHGKPLICS